MHRKLLKIAGAALLSVVATGPSLAATCTLDGSNVGIAAAGFTCTIDEVNKTIMIEETYSNAGIGIVKIEGLVGSNYTVTKKITNGSGVDWLRMANELLDPAGQANDADDVLPYPAFVPAGYTTSNNTDGLSFDQNGSIPRTSSAFASVFADEFSDVREFIDFHAGLHANGAFHTMSFGLDTGSDNDPFLLVQRPNESSRVPEPGTLLLLGAAMVGLGARRRRA